MDGNDWFTRWFWPAYPDDVRAHYNESMEQDANPANNPSFAAHLSEAAELFVSQAPKLLGTELTFDGDGVARLAKALNRETRDALVARSKEADPESLFFNVVVHGALYVGECAVRSHGARWSVRRPLWESRVLRFVREGDGERAIGGFSPFQWMLKQLSDDEIDEGRLGDRFRMHVEFATAKVEDWAVLTTAQRLPAMKAPDYDTLVKYLHKHLPELKDLGVGFPTAQEFTERKYTSVSLDPMHGGRVIALHGQGAAEKGAKSTVDVHWLTAQGCVRSDVVPCDAHPPYFARKTGESLEVTFALDEKPYTHRLGVRGHG